MLSIVCAATAMQGRAYALDQICAGSKKALRGQILIVPEQFSFDAEWALCQAGGDTISAFGEVLSFTRLASRVFSVAGGAARATLNKSGRLLAMAQGLDQIGPRLKLYGKHRAKPEFLLQLLQIFDEFESYGVTGAGIRQAIGSVPGTLAEKLEELSLIMEAYRAVCQNGLLDPATRLSRLEQALWESDYAQGRQIFVDGFIDFTAQELGVLSALMDRCAQMTVTLCCDDFAQGQAVFATTRETARQLRQLAERQGVTVRNLTLPPQNRLGPLQHLQNELFASRMESWKEKTPTIVLTPCKDVHEEGMHLVRQVQELHRQGVDYRDIAVAYTEEKTYKPLLENLFCRYQIPGYFSGNGQILQQPVIRLVTYAVEAAACGMEPEAVAEYIKTGLVPIDGQWADRLENYALTWNIRGAAWEKRFTRHPEGYGREETEETKRYLAQLDKAREQAIGPLLTLKQGLHSAQNIAQQVQCVDRFLTSIGLAERLEKQANILANQGQLQQAQTCRQLYSIVTDTMEQMYGVLGQSVYSPEAFCGLLCAALGQGTVGTIPAAVNSVRVGSLAAVRNTGGKYLLVLGACDGLLPAVAQGGSLLSDEERKQMSQAGLSVAPTAGQRLERELLAIYMALTGPSQGLQVSCLAGEPSYIYLRLEGLFPLCVGKSRRPLPVSILQAAADPSGAAGDPPPPVARERERLQRQAGYTPGHLDAQAVTALYGRQIRLSASRIDQLASCRYAYFLQYGLGAKERAQGAINAPFFGTLVHEVLERTAQKVMEEGGFAHVSRQRLQEVTRQATRVCVEERFPDLTILPQREAYLLQRSFGEIGEAAQEMWQELRQSRFVPQGFELRFSGENAITVEGKQARCAIRGVVDRVDLYTAKDGKTYVRVVDYKTGQKDFDYTDILNGTGLQMLLYLYALQQRGETYFGGPVEPAGVLYFPARLPVITKTAKPTAVQMAAERQKALGRKGLLLAQEEVLQAMEPCQDTPVYLPYSKDKRGHLQGDLANRQQMALLSRHVYREVGRLTDELFRGQIAPNPYARGEYSPCRWCAYGAVCHKSSGCVEQRKLAEIKAERFWQLLEQEDSHGGD